MMKGDNKMIELGIAVIVGIVIGVGGALGVQQASKPKEPTIVQVGGDEVAKGQVEVQKQLIDLDLLVVPCSSEYVTANNDLLCREMFCRMQQRGIDAQTSQQDCSEISNIANTKAIQKSCENMQGEVLEACIDLFFKRK